MQAVVETSKGSNRVRNSSMLERCNDIAFLADLMGHESIETSVGVDDVTVDCHFTQIKENTHTKQKYLLSFLVSYLLSEQIFESPDFLTHSLLFFPVN